MEATEFTSEALQEIRVRPVEPGEEARYQEQMARHHYLGALAKIGETAWYVATWREQWVAQLNLSAAALQCGVRDRWIGWDLRSQYGRLNLIANSTASSSCPEFCKSITRATCETPCPLWKSRSRPVSWPLDRPTRFGLDDE